MTVMGDVVRRSWALCEEAVRDGVVCLYEPPEGTTLRLHLKTFLCNTRVVTDCLRHRTTWNTAMCFSCALSTVACVRMVQSE